MENIESDKIEGVAVGGGDDVECNWLDDRLFSNPTPNSIFTTQNLHCDDPIKLDTHPLSLLLTPHMVSLSVWSHFSMQFSF